jgi:anti-anti-sigma regulatory factor
MFTVTEAPGGKRQIALPANLDHAVAHDLRAALVECLARGQDIDVNASEVSRPSTPAMQVLVAAYSAAEDGKSGAMELIAPSQAFRDFAAMLALEEALGLTEISA